MQQTFNIFEWMFETINKRLGPPYNIPLEKLFLVVPNEDEAEFEYEILHIFKTAGRKLGVSQGNALALDYPNIAKLAANEIKTLKIRVFFVKPSRQQNILILDHRKYPYPKVNQKNKENPAFDLTNTDIEVAVREHYAKERRLNAKN